MLVFRNIYIYGLSSSPNFKIGDYKIKISCFPVLAHCLTRPENPVTFFSSSLHYFVRQSLTEPRANHAVRPAGLGGPRYSASASSAYTYANSLLRLTEKIRGGALYVFVSVFKTRFQGEVCSQG